MEQLDLICKHKGWSRSRLAQELGVSRNRLCEFVSGRRPWPHSTVDALQQLLGEPGVPPSEWYLPWAAHQRLARNRRWEVVVDPGGTWADGPSRYEDIYRQLDPQRTPPDCFRRLIRVDSQLEALAWTELCEDGATPLFASPVLLGFPQHVLVDHQTVPIGTQYRAALTGKFDNLHWILWPQLTVWLPDGTIRPDGVLMANGAGRTRWGFFQLDGSSHRDKAYDTRQDQRLHPLPTLRCASAPVLGMHFPEHFREGIRKLLS